MSLISVVVTPANPSIPNGVTKQFTASGTYSDGTTKDITSTVVWISGTTSVATVNSSGLVTGVSVGTSTITATSGTISGNTTLTVNSAVLQSISVSPANPSIPKGLTQQFTATGNYSNGTSFDITAQVTWSSGTTSVATINANGLGTAVGVGTSTITATSGAISGNTTLTVTAAVLQTISVTPANPSIPKGLTQQFTATGNYSDGTSQNLTSTVTWTSGTTSVATLNSSGLATGVGVGTSTITATSGAIFGNTTLTVSAAVLQSITVTPVTP
ncbi:MAG: Ig-like domain-containing protein, partial [Nitrospirae bacterium]|nr:Ig-like domain-containing protein [Nitrospirota bacterium]